MYPPDFPSFFSTLKLSILFILCLFKLFIFISTFSSIRKTTNQPLVHLYILFKHSIGVIPLSFEVGKIFLQPE